MNLNNSLFNCAWAVAVVNCTEAVVAFASVKAAKLIQILFALQLQRLFFKQEKWFYTVNDTPFFDCKSNWSLFTGARGSNNKAVLYTNKAFYTIACAENVAQLTTNEDEILKEIPRPSRGFIAPLLRMVNNSINALSNVSMFILIQSI